MDRIAREVHVLRWYAFVTAPLLGVLTLAAFTQKQRFGEIDVQRINVIEPDGKVRMVISNKTRAPDAVLGGKTFKRQGGNSAGIIFYNEEGDEDGGLVFGGKSQNGRYEAGGALLFDQFRQDQIVGIQYGDENGRRYAGLQVWDRPEIAAADALEQYDAIGRMPDGPARRAALEQLRASGAWDAPVRVFVGRDRGKAAIVNLADREGHVRARLLVDSLGAPRLEFLDAGGRVIYAVPDSGRGR
jgi:hypothetical protein